LIGTRGFGLICSRSLRWRNLNHIGRGRVGELVVGIVVAWRYRFVIVRPPEGAIHASDNYPAKEKPEGCAVGGIASIIVPVVASVVSSGIIVASIVVSRNKASL